MPIKQSHINYLLTDSIRNGLLLSFVKKIFKRHGIEEISYMRFSNNGTFKLVTSYNENHIYDYLRFRFWKFDGFLKHREVYQGYAVQIRNSECKLMHYFGQQVYILIDEHYMHFKDRFIFSVNRYDFNKLQSPELLLLHNKLLSAMQYLYKRIRWEQEYKIFLPGIKSQYYEYKNLIKNLPELLDHFQLTAINYTYLVYIATGCTAKEIALHIDKSYKTVQTHILNLSAKFNVHTKEQLVDIAKMVVSQVSFTNPKFNLI